MLRTMTTGLAMAALWWNACRDGTCVAAIPEDTDPARVTGPKPMVESTKPGPAEPSARSRLRTSTWDFGTILSNTQVRHRFSITNDSASPWTVQFVSKSCSCTVGEFSPRVIKPSETAFLEVIFRASNREGTVFQSITVDFAEKGTPVGCFVLKGEVRNSLSASPSALDFGRVSSGGRVTRSVALCNFSGEDLALTKLEVPEWLQAEQQPVRPNGPKSRAHPAWDLVVHLEPGKLKPGSKVGTLVIHTNSEKLGPVSIPVSVQVEAPLAAFPSRLAFNTGEDGQIARQSLLLVASPELGPLSEKEFVLTHDLGEELVLQISPTLSPTRFLLVGEYRPKRARRPVQGELEINVRKGDVPPVHVKVSGNVR